MVAGFVTGLRPSSTSGGRGLLRRAGPGGPAAGDRTAHRRAAARAVVAGLAVPDDLAGVHAAVRDRGLDGLAELAVQPRDLVRLEGVRRALGGERPSDSVSSTSRFPIPE